jgi:hypothetical protein
MGDALKSQSAAEVHPRIDIDANVPGCSGRPPPHRGHQVVQPIDPLPLRPRASARRLSRVVVVEAVPARQRGQLFF